jgi:hypothetical protein
VIFFGRELFLAPKSGGRESAGRGRQRGKKQRKDHEGQQEPKESKQRKKVKAARTKNKGKKKNILCQRSRPNFSKNPPFPKAFAF